MKKLVISALAASMASATALASESEWADLDREIQALTATLPFESTGPNFSGYIRGIYASSSDVMVGGNDLGGFDILNARLKLSGKQGNVGYVLQAGFEDAGSASLLKDAYVEFPVGENIFIRAGQFKAFISRDALVGANKLFFVDRSRIGSLFSSRREGLAIHGNFDQFDWFITVQDGGDGDGDEYLIALRGQLHFLGEGGIGFDQGEGAYFTQQAIHGTVGISYWDDGAVDDNDGLLVDAAIASEQFSVSVSIADIGDALVPPNGSVSASTIMMPAALEADSTPFSIAGTFALNTPSDTQGAWEFGVRFQDLDNTDDTTVLEAGVNYYGSAARHNHKLFFNFVNGDGDVTDVSGFILGFNIGF